MRTPSPCARKAKTKIFGDVGFMVADADEIRFAPYVQRTGAYDVRGTVIDPQTTEEFTWNPYNFEGFYYDIDDDVGTETLHGQDNRRHEDRGGGSDLYHQTPAG